MDLLIATRNTHKLIEIQGLLVGLPLRIDTLSSHPGLVEPEETGTTFAENARLKAVYYSQHTGRRSVAEDSGLEIDALDGDPGVRSARFDGASYPEKFAAIYARLRERGEAGSTARFVCALAVAQGRRTTFEARGVVEGTIARTPAGAAGFGYDPIFLLPERGVTMAELAPGEKDRISHRGIAARKALEDLRRMAGGA